MKVRPCRRWWPLVRVILAFVAGLKVLITCIRFCQGESAAMVLETSVVDADGSSGSGIFFLESSGRACVTARQACSIESAVRANPSVSVRLHIVTPLGSVGDRDGDSGGAATRRNRADCRLSRHLHRMNVSIVRERATDLLSSVSAFRKSLLRPDSDDKNSGFLAAGLFRTMHLSDAARVAILHRSGGVYLDSDVIVLRSLQCLHNTAAFIWRPGWSHWIENGVLAFDAGHPLLELLGRVMVQSYRPAERESIGPPALALAWRLFCGIGADEPFNAGVVYRCRQGRNLKLQPPSAFYAIGHHESHLFYEKSTDPRQLERSRLNESLASHVYFQRTRTVPLSHDCLGWHQRVAYASTDPPFCIGKSQLDRLQGPHQSTMIRKISTWQIE